MDFSGGAVMPEHKNWYNIIVDGILSELRIGKSKEEVIWLSREGIGAATFGLAMLRTADLEAGPAKICEQRLAGVLKHIESRLNKNHPDLIDKFVKQLDDTIQSLREKSGQSPPRSQLLLVSKVQAVVDAMEDDDFDQGA